MFLSVFKLIWILGLIYLSYRTFVNGVASYKTSKVYKDESDPELIKKKTLAQQAVGIWLILTFAMLGMAVSVINS